MAVRIRMKRIGAKNRPCYRIVAADSRSPRDGRFLENLGTYDPLLEGKNFTINRERVLYWLGVGARVSDTVAVLLKKEGIAREKPAGARAAGGGR
ncbi:MAG: 30S ribosomal protein S16 [bacterium]|nr:30S ribosomal protein S16 [bacterium]